MKRIYFSFLILTVIIAWIGSQGIGASVRTSTSGSANGGGNTGSPIDGQTCSQSFCHNDASPVQISPNSDLSTDVPNTGYIPGQTYTVTAQITKSGHSKFGFEVTAETSSSKVGTFTSTSSNTQLTNNDNAVTHTSSGTSGAGGKTWTFEWDAPAAGTGDVMFHGAFNVTNGNGGTSGDTIHTDTTLVQEDTSATKIPFQKTEERSELSLYPNPAKEHVSIDARGRELENARFILRDFNGRMVKEIRNKGSSSRIHLGLDGIPSGAYLLEVNGGKKRSVEKLIVE